MTRLALAFCLLASPVWAGEIAGYATVTDGDTLRIGAERIRIAAIDSPERDQTCGNRACGAEATAALSALVSGQIVSCTPTGHSYNRVVARCKVAGQDIGEAMIRMGQAVRYARYDRERRYCAAESEARAARRGIWSGDFVQPAEWRREHRR